MFESHRLFRVLPLGNIAEIILDSETAPLTKSNAAAMLRHRLREFNGAMWVGAPLHERNAVIAALRMTA